MQIFFCSLSILWGIAQLAYAIHSARDVFQNRPQLLTADEDAQLRVVTVMALVAMVNFGVLFIAVGVIAL
jgi:hypothetical protein